MLQSAAMNEARAWSPDEVSRAGVLACLLEVSAEKPGNVTPTHDFRDMSFEDMLASAVAMGPELARAGVRPVGEGVLAVVAASRLVAGANTNLGIALLLVPLARAAVSSPPDATLRVRLGRVLGALDVADARRAYEAIRLAGPGGVDVRVRHDVHDEPTITLAGAMAQAASRDAIAAEYATEYGLTFEHGLPALERSLAAGLAPRQAVVEVFLELLAAQPDTLIARKRGQDAAAVVSARAGAVLSAGGVRTTAGREALSRFDGSLRTPDNELNPGATADLVASVLFVGLLAGIL
jgi:triphosphoribosyl-dephospho-CoA synthase